MRHYETIFIINPDLNEEDTVQVVEHYTAMVGDQGGVLAKVDQWGRRRLAYEVKKYNKGYFVLFEFGAEPGLVEELERNFKIDERVIRYLTVKQGDFFDEEAARAAMAAAQESPAGKREEEDDDAPSPRADDDDQGSDDDDDQNDDGDDEDDDN